MLQGCCCSAKRDAPRLIQVGGLMRIVVFLQYLMQLWKIYRPPLAENQDLVLFS